MVSLYERNYYNVYNKDVETGGIKVFFAGRRTDRIVLKEMKFVFFLNMGEEGSFTNILGGK